MKGKRVSQPTCQRVGIRSIALFAVISDFWEAITFRKRIWDATTGNEIPLYSICVRVIGPLGVLTYGVLESGNILWRVGRIAWLNRRAYSAYRQSLPPSVVRQIIENMFWCPLSRKEAAASSEIGRSTTSDHAAPEGGGTDNIGLPVGESCVSMEAKAFWPSSDTCTVKPLQDFSSSSVISGDGISSANTSVSGPHPADNSTSTKSVHG